MNVCRICLENDCKLIAIFEPGKPVYISALIMSCTSVKVTEGDGLPSFICPECLSKLKIAAQFKTDCESADAKLRERLNSESLKVFQCNETSEKPKFKNMYCYKFDKQFSSNNLRLQHYDNTSMNSINETGPSLNEEVDDDSLQMAENNEITNNKSTKDIACHICDKTFNKKRNLIHHMRIHTGERPFTCNLCNKRFKVSGHLHTHMKTHTGERNYLCSDCPKAFPTAQQLRKHITAIHTTERPHVCPYCNKRFANPSNLNTHILIHSGKKNYSCEYCGKAFLTKSLLSQHLLVHSERKAFACDSCEKRFAQKAHLVRHLKIHVKQP